MRSHAQARLQPTHQHHFIMHRLGASAPQDRADLAEQLEKRPDAMWRTGTLWSFKNDAKASGRQCR